MLPHGIAQSEDAPILERIKIVSGWCIEERRKRLRMTQDNLASDVGIAVRWLREIEAGNPKGSIDDHLRCAAALGIASSYLLILLIFMERQMTFPRDLLLDDLEKIEDRCVACLAEFSVESLAKRLNVIDPVSSPRR